MDQSRDGPMVLVHVVEQTPALALSLGGPRLAGDTFRSNIQAPYAVQAGNRQLVGTGTTGSMDSCHMPVLIAAALNIRPRSYPRSEINRHHEGWGWTLWVLERATGHSYEADIPAEKFGMTEQERETLRAFLQNRSDPSSILPFLDGYRSTQDQVARWWQRRDGGIVSTVNHTIHGSTVGCVLAWLDPAEGNRPATATWVSPQRDLRNSPRSYCERHGDTFVVRAVLKNDGTPFERRFSGFDPADDLWGVVFDNQGARMIGAPAPVGPDLFDGPTHRDYAPILQLTAGLTHQQVDEQEVELLQIAGEAVRRLSFWRNANGERARVLNEVARAADRLAQQADRSVDVTPDQPVHTEYDPLLSEMYRLVLSRNEEPERELVAVTGEIYRRIGLLPGSRGAQREQIRESIVRGANRAASLARA